MSERRWDLGHEFFFDDTWSQERLHCYAHVIEGKKSKPNYAIVYSKDHRGYECPTCCVFHDKNIDVVTRHSLHCGHQELVKDQRGWWAPATK